MNYRRKILLAIALGLIPALHFAAKSSGAVGKFLDHEHLEVNGTVWVANRGAHTIRGFDAATGETVATINMAALSQPGDLAYAKRKLYVAEEFGVPPAIAIVDAETGVILNRIFTGPRPHHVHASVGGNLIAYGVFGTNRVGIIDTQTDTLLGEWQASANGAARSTKRVPRRYPPRPMPQAGVNATEGSHDRLSLARAMPIRLQHSRERTKARPSRAAHIVPAL